MSSIASRIAHGSCVRVFVCSVRMRWLWSLNVQQFTSARVADGCVYVKVVGSRTTIRHDRLGVHAGGEIVGGRCV